MRDNITDDCHVTFNRDSLFATGGLLTMESKGKLKPVYTINDSLAKIDNSFKVVTDSITIVIPCTLVVGPVGVDDSRSGLPKSFELRQNYPNPFNPSTQISFTLPSKANVELTIYDLLGRKVRMLLDSRLDAGYHSVTWDGRHENGGQVTSGVYFYALKADDYFASQKMILMK